MAIELTPAIDLLDRRVVRLAQGKRDEVTVYSDDPLEFVRPFEEAGARRLHVVDLNGAFDGAFHNLDLVEAVCRKTRMRVELGGGIRSVEAARQAWAAGVSDVILGTKALEDEALVDALLAERADGVIVGIDARDGYVATRGWVEKSAVKAIDFAQRVAQRGCRRIIYTDVATDGMLSGPNLAALTAMAEAVPAVEIVASGGIAKLDDVQAVRDLGLANIVGIISGRAVYDGRLDLASAVRLLEAAG